MPLSCFIHFCLPFLDTLRNAFGVFIDSYHHATGMGFRRPQIIDIIYTAITNVSSSVELTGLGVVSLNGSFERGTKLSGCFNRTADLSAGHVLRYRSGRAVKRAENRRAGSGYLPTRRKGKIHRRTFFYYFFLILTCGFLNFVCGILSIV